MKLYTSLTYILLSRKIAKGMTTKMKALDERIQTVLFVNPLNSVSKVSMREQGQRRLQARKNGPGLTRSTLAASAFVRLYDISKLHAFPMFLH